MSVFLGHVELDGGQIPPAAGTVMESGFRYAGGRDFSRRYFSGGLMAHLATHVTREDRFSQQPIETERYVVAASVRLDNRAALVRDLCLDRSDGLSDAELLAAAYGKWANNCFEKLLGDWCCAIWDKLTRSLVLARDATGSSSLVWWSDGRRAVFSTTVGCLVANPAVPITPDPLVTACFLTFFDDPEIESRTFFKDVHRVVPGGYVVIDSHGCNACRWWHPFDLPRLAFRTEQECDDAFMALYRDAVDVRLRHDEPGAVALMLSAGLDSSSVLALAAPELAKRGERLKAYVHRPFGGGGRFGDDAVDDEFEAASFAATHVGNTDVTGVATPGGGWVASIRESVATFGEPAPSAVSFYWISDVLRTLSAAGNTVLLTGQGGNGTVSYSGDGDLLKHARSRGWRYVFEQIQATRMGRRRAIRYQIVDPLVRRARSWLPARRRPPADAWAGHFAIHRDLAGQVKLWDRFEAKGQRLDDQPPYSDHQMRMWRVWGSLGNSVGARWLNAGDRFGFEMRDPTRDKRIVEFCWQLPDEFFWGGGRQRMLLRRNMLGKLPLQSLNHPIRGVQSADMPGHAIAEMPLVKRLIDAASRDPLFAAWVDVQLLQNLTSGIASAPTAAAYRILYAQLGPALALMQFWSHFGFCGTGYGGLDDF